MLFASLEPGGKSWAPKDAFCTFTIIPLTLFGDVRNHGAFFANVLGVERRLRVIAIALF